MAITIKFMKKDYYTYEVIEPITDYGYNLKIGDYMTSRQVDFLPPYYRRCVRLLNQPIPQN